jgi:integrase
MLDTFKMILRSAKERGQTVDEAVLRVRPPRRERAEMRFLDWSEVELIASETVEPYDNLVRLACLTGLRQGELFALRDRALDLPRRTIVVEAGARDGKIVPPKTAAGRRQIRLSGEAVRVLRGQLLARAPNDLAGSCSRRQAAASGARTTSWLASSGPRSDARISHRSASTTSGTRTPR